MAMLNNQMANPLVETDGIPSLFFMAQLSVSPYAK